MTGYRTILFNAIMLAGSLLGFHMAPEQATQYVDAIVLLWGGGNVVLRGITKGPIFGGSKPPTSVASLAMLIALTLSLSACGAVSWNDQNDAGITKAEVSTALDAEGKPYISSARIISGKELGQVNLDVEHPSGLKVHYAATAVAAFKGQEIRSGVEKQVSSDLKEAVPDVAKTVGGIVKDIVVPAPLVP